MGILKKAKRGQRRNVNRIRGMVSDMKDSLQYTLRNDKGERITKTGVEWKTYFDPLLNKPKHHAKEDHRHLEADPRETTMDLHDR